MDFSVRQGFSLIELLVVIAIMGIMSVIALPQLSGYMREFRLNQSTNAVLSALRSARANAIKNFREVRARANLDKERMKFVICDGPGDCSDETYYPGLDWVNHDGLTTLSVMDGVDLYGIRHQTAHEGKDAEWHWATSGIHPIEFLPTGTKSFEALVLTYKPTPATSNPCQFTTIYMGSTGQPRIVRSNKDSHSETSYGAYDQSDDGTGGPWGYEFDKVPECAK